MVIDDGAEEDEDNNRTVKLLWSCGKADAVASERRTVESDVVEVDEIVGNTISAVTNKRVQRGTMPAIATQWTISMRQHPIEDEADHEVTFKILLPGETPAAAKPTRQNECHSWWISHGFRTSYRLCSES